jgi:hypothetical protein
MSDQDEEDQHDLRLVQAQGRTSLDARCAGVSEQTEHILQAWKGSSDLHVMRHWEEQADFCIHAAQSLSDDMRRETQRLLKQCGRHPLKVKAAKSVYGPHLVKLSAYIQDLKKKKRVIKSIKGSVSRCQWLLNDEILRLS